MVVVDKKRHTEKEREISSLTGIDKEKDGRGRWSEKRGGGG